MGTLRDLYEVLDGWEPGAVPTRIDLHPDQTLAELDGLLRSDRNAQALAFIRTETTRLRPLVRSVLLGVATPTRQEPGTTPFVLPEFLAGLHVTAARLRMAEGDLDGTREELIAAVTLEPANDVPRYALVEVYEAAGEHTQARSLLERLLADNEDAPHSLLELGDSAERRGALDDARATYERAAELDGIGIVRELAELRLASLGDLPDESTLATWYDKATQAIEDRKPRGATGEFVKVLAYETRHHQSWFGLAWASQDLSGGVAFGDAPDSHAMFWTVAEPAREALARAMQGYRLAINFGPRDALMAPAYHQLANCLLYAGRPAEALDKARAAAQLDPDDAGVVADLALALFSCGDHAAAAERARRALELDPTNTPARLTLARALVSLGDDQGIAENFDEIMAAVQIVQREQPEDRAGA